MKKNVIVFGIVLLFLGLAFTPIINSSFIQIQSEIEEENDDNEFIEVEVYNFKGKYGYEKTLKQITIKDYQNLIKEQENIESESLSLEDQIKLKIKLFKNFNLLSQDFSYEYMQLCIQDQKSYLQNMANIGNFLEKIHKEEFKTISNFLCFVFFTCSDSFGITIGFPPWRVFWGIGIPFIPKFSIWANALISTEQGSIETIGIDGYRYLDSLSFVLLYGFIGCLIILAIPDFESSEINTREIAFGFSAYCMAGGE
jgi:hypothetical protein